MSEKSEPGWVLTPPSAYDIVACWYPERQSPDDPGPALRPGLVTHVLRGETTGRFACRVAYGTKKLKIVQRTGLDIIVQNSQHIRELGLSRATRFDLDLTVVVPWGTEFFGCWTRYPTPIIGSLTETYIKEYAYLMMRRASAQPDDDDQASQ
jgi:hypothetical protein